MKQTVLDSLDEMMRQAVAAGEEHAQALLTQARRILTSLPDMFVPPDVRLPPAQEEANAETTAGQDDDPRIEAPADGEVHWP